MEKREIGKWGAASALITLIITKSLISTPSLFARRSASAGWIEVLISGLFELIVLAIVLKLAAYFENKDPVDIAYIAFGSVGKYITGMISILVFIISSAAVFRCFCELMRDNVLKGISYNDVSLFVLIASIAGAFLGVGVLINSCGVILPFVLISLCVIVLINTPRYSISNILPVSGYGIDKLLYNSFFKNASFFEIGALLYFVPKIGEKTSVKKIGFTALIVSVLLSSVLALSYQLSVPYEVSGTFALPLYQMTRMIKAGTFFQRIEPLNVFVWGGAMYTYVSIGVRISADIYKKTFSLTHAKPLVFVFAYIVSLVALIPSSETNVERIYDFLMTYSYIAYPILPLLLLICSKLFGRKGCIFEKN